MERRWRGARVFKSALLKKNKKKNKKEQATTNIGAIKVGPKNGEGIRFFGKKCQKKLLSKKKENKKMFNARNTRKEKNKESWI